MSNKRNLWLTDVCNKLAQRFGICVDRGCNHLGLPDPRGIPRNRPIVTREMFKLERPTFGVAKQAMQKDDRLPVSARTERQLTVRLPCELQRRANWHRRGRTVSHGGISYQRRITSICFFVIYSTKQHFSIFTA